VDNPDAKPARFAAYLLFILILERGHPVPLSVILIAAGRYLPVKADMHLRITNIKTETPDVYRFSFESAGALALDNEYSGFAVLPALYIAFVERKHACRQ
jgi:hypothetical protein